MQTKAVARHVRFSAQKGRLVADQIRGMEIMRAVDLLTFSGKRAAATIKKVLDSAVANAEHNHGADVDELRVSAIYVDEGPTLKRHRARAKGRASGILKRTCHITVEVSDE